MAAPYAPPIRNPRPRERAVEPAPMMARLIGIIGRTHGVRFSANPPRNTISRIASGPRPSKSPGSFTPSSALRMNFRKSRVPRYPPVAARMVKSSRDTTRAAASTAFPGLMKSVAFTGAALGVLTVMSGGLPCPKAIRSKTSVCCRAPAAFAGTMRSLHSASAVFGAKQVVSLHA